VPTTRRVYEHIADAISQQIDSGELSAGQLLPAERALAERFGASRASVREALLALQSAGRVTMRQRARARVTQSGRPALVEQLPGLSQAIASLPNGVGDFQEARVLFECGLARHAARHASRRDIDRLAAALMRNKKALRDATAFAETDVAFHNVLAEIPRNPVFTALNSALSEWLLAQRTIGIRAPVRGAMRNAYRGHARVYEAVAAHDAEAADKAMGHHLVTVTRYFWKGMAARANDDGHVVTAPERA
jgi:GntR family transcriptional repressor for pyruvate dehydrogenase complex